MIVLRTRSNSVREWLVTEKDLELGKAVTFCRSAEQAHELVQEMNAESKDEAAVAEGSDRVKWTCNEWPSRRIPNSNVKRLDHDTGRPKNFIVVILNTNKVEDVVRMVTYAGCARSDPYGKIM
jgi:hypothetical protein